MSVVAVPITSQGQVNQQMLEVSVDCPFAIAPSASGRATLCRKAWQDGQLLLVGLMDCASTAVAMSVLQQIPEYQQWESDRLRHGVNVQSIADAKLRLVRTTESQSPSMDM